MSKESKRARELHGPGLGEIVFGVALSLMLGVLLGVAHLVFKPVEIQPVAKGKDAPAVPSDSVLYPPVYFIAGSNSGGSGYKAKQPVFLASSGPISLNEQELNAFIAAAAPPPPPPPKTAPATPPPPTPAPAEKTKPVPTPFVEATLNPGVINFRVQDGVLQAAMAGKFSLLGLDLAPLVQVRGGFIQGADGFVLQPTEFYVGSLPLHRIPGLSGWLLHRLLAAQQGVPAELTTAWHKLTSVAVEGDTLKLAP